MHRFNINKLFSPKRIPIILIMLLALFLVSGGFYALQSYMNGGQATTYQEYLMGMLYPMFLGCIMMGSYGLLFSYINRKSPVCLVGFLIVGICYIFIEYLFNAIGGNNIGGFA